MHTVVWKKILKFPHFVKVHNKFIYFWLQLARSKFEAAKYEYAIQLDHPKIGKFQYQGPVLSIDNSHDDINEALCGLIIPRKIAEELVSENKFYLLEISIINCTKKTSDWVWKNTLPYYFLNVSQCGKNEKFTLT